MTQNVIPAFLLPDRVNLKGEVHTMLKADIQDAFNRHINAEMYSAYLYLSMAAWFETQNLSGMAGWMKAQSREEWGHAMKFYEYVSQRGGAVKLAAIEAPPAEWLPRWPSSSRFASTKPRSPV